MSFRRTTRGWFHGGAIEDFIKSPWLVPCVGDESKTSFKGTTVVVESLWGSNSLGRILRAPEVPGRKNFSGAVSNGVLSW